MLIDVVDFAGADHFFETTGRSEWAELRDVLDSCTVQLQPSDQAGLNRRPIFDPKATNHELTQAAAAHGWHPIPVPDGLKEFGFNWDAGKNSTLVEWQFSNYPFLWNNVIRTQGVYKSRIKLAGMSGVDALVVVTKSGQFPASNSTLYFEQARAQLQAVMGFQAFTIPIRLVGICIDPSATSLDVVWNTYANPRYDRVPASSSPRTFNLRWSQRVAKHGNRTVLFE